MKRYVWVGAIACAAAVGIYYTFYGLTYTWHQTLTLVVDTPDGSKRGSATVEVRVWTQHMIPGRGTTGAGSHRGEATFVEVAPGRYLFALLRSRQSVDHPRYIATHAFFDQVKKDDGVNIAWSRLERLHATALVPRKHYPMLVTFMDLADPTSAREVDPDDLAATFGEGVKLKAIEITLSNAPVTDSRVSEVLTWLKDIPPGYQLDGAERVGPIRSASSARRLGVGAFSTEMQK